MGESKMTDPIIITKEVPGLPPSKGTTDSRSTAESPGSRATVIHGPTITIDASPSLEHHEPATQTGCRSA